MVRYGEGDIPSCDLYAIYQYEYIYIYRERKHCKYQKDIFNIFRDIDTASCLLTSRSRLNESFELGDRIFPMYQRNHLAISKIAQLVNIY
jgi:hypothetical protein